MQCGHGQVTGFSKGERVFHCVAVADFTDQNYIRRLAQGVFQRREPVLGIHPDFALGDDAILVLVHEFHRVLDGNDMAVAVFVAVAGHRRERCGFAAAGAAHKNHDPTLAHGDIFQHRRQVEFLKFRNCGGDGA